MTEPVQGVLRTGGVARRSTSEERKRRQYAHILRNDTDENDATDDTVEISEEARKRADGTYRKNILEHIEDSD